MKESLRQCLNEFKLKKYFRQVFGLSVFALVQEERLKRAKQLSYFPIAGVAACAVLTGDVASSSSTVPNPA